MKRQSHKSIHRRDSSMRWHLQRLLLLAWFSSLDYCDARASSSSQLPLAGIFGFGGGNDKNEGDKTAQQTPRQQQFQNQQQQLETSNRDGWQTPPFYGNGRPPPVARGQPTQMRAGQPPPLQQQQQRPPFIAQTQTRNPPTENIPPSREGRRTPPPPPRPNQQQAHQGQPIRPPPPPPVPGSGGATQLSSAPQTATTSHKSVGEESSEALTAEESEIVTNADGVNTTVETNEVHDQEQLPEEEVDISLVLDTDPSSPLESQQPYEVDQEQTEPPPEQGSSQGWTNPQTQGWADSQVTPTDYQAWQPGMAQQPPTNPYPYDIPLSPPPPAGMHGGAPPPQQQQQQEPPMMYQNELDMALAREYDLFLQLQNVTDFASNLQQREQLHIRQLDVLTERVMDVEAQAAGDRNLLVETEANCTALGMTIASLNDELDEWKKRCTELSGLRDQDEERLTELKQAIKEKSSEAEELAIAIENLRLVERVKKGSSSSLRDQKKGRGLFGWILSLFVGTESEDEEMSREEAYELGKSTLLRALQTERSSVMELEAVVASLQRNNSAISEMVESRDLIIDELNNRIAVFEEDKVVLKAALKQLQKEIQDEAPKTQKLMDDLMDSKEEVKKLNAEINSIIRTHQAEINSLQKTVLVKQKAINETESNLTAIGTYVDKLEERLTSFAITRRDIEEREKKCKEIEESATKAEEEIKVLTSKVEEYAKQQEDLKKLLEEMAVERANLQKENRKLLTDREFRIGEEERLQSTTRLLETNVQQLTQSLNEAKEEVNTLKVSLEATRSSNSELQEQVNRIEDLESKLESSRLANVELSDESRLSKEKLEASLAESGKELERLKLELELANKKLSETVNPAPTNDAKQSLDQTTQHEDSLARKEGLPDPRFPSRNVPFRTIRKKLSQTTGLHGLVTPSSKMEHARLRQLQSPQRRGPPRRPLKPQIRSDDLANISVKEATDDEQSFNDEPVESLQTSDGVSEVQEAAVIGNEEQGDHNVDHYSQPPLPPNTPPNPDQLQTEAEGTADISRGEEQVPPPPPQWPPQ